MVTITEIKEIQVDPSSYIPYIEFNANFKLDFIAHDNTLSEHDICELIGKQVVDAVKQKIADKKLTKKD